MDLIAATLGDAARSASAGAFGSAMDVDYVDDGTLRAVRRGTPLPPSLLLLRLLPSLIARRSSRVACCGTGRP